MTDQTRIQDAQPRQPPEWVRQELGGATGRGVRVAVVDSGWDRAIHDERVLPGIGFVDPDDDFGMARNDDDHDVLGHGTACAGLILGVAPDARVVPVKVFGKVLETSPGTLHAALLWCIEAGVQVINVSLGTRLEGTLHPLYAACEKARRAGIIVVAAGHNANDWSYPAIFENVIGVSAARFASPFHFRYRAEHAMECEAWGMEQPVLWIGGQRVIKHGTSFAAPNVAGIVALILERHRGATIEQVREMLSRFALPADEAADAVPFPGPRQPQPATSGRRKRTSPPDEMAAPKPGTRRRKGAAQPSNAAEEPSSPAKKAATPRKRAAAPARASNEAAPSAADKKPRKRTTKSEGDTAPPGAAARSRKRAAAPDRAADRAASDQPAKSRGKRAQAPVQVVPGSASTDATAGAEGAKRLRRTADRSVRAASRNE